MHKSYLKEALPELRGSALLPIVQSKDPRPTADHNVWPTIYRKRTVQTIRLWFSEVTKNLQGAFSAQFGMP